MTFDYAQKVRTLGASLEHQIIEWRRYYHAHPELSLHEFSTCEHIERELDALGFEHKRVANTGIIATIRGGAPGSYTSSGVPCTRIALRADIDALPVEEKNDVSYVSQNKGVMHACGHDCHIAMMLGALHILKACQSTIKGEIRVIFQPAEEISDGAQMMIDAGALEGVSAIYGAHIWSEVQAGTISCAPGQRMAHTDWFRIDIEGVSAHGSMPHKGVDALVVGAEMVTGLQVLVSRDVSPFEPVVVTVGEFHSGTARNIMAGSAYLTGTIRTWSKQLRTEVPKRLKRIATDIADSFGATARFTYEEGNPGLSNTPEEAQRCERAVRTLLGDAAVSDYRGTLSGEDFAYYLEYVPGVFAFIGARNEELGANYPQHSCFYTIDESALVGGSMVAALWALDYLQEHA